MVKKDIYWRDKAWEKLKKDNFGLDDLSDKNRKLIIEFLKDFELGKNVPKSCKGRRSAATLLKLRGIGIFLNKHFNKSFLKLTQNDLHKLFDDMYKGKILKANGKPYKAVGEKIKQVKTFWGWVIKTGKQKEDITRDLSRSGYSRGKPAWVYLTHDQIKRLIDNARGDYRALILFLYDSGIRPSEITRLKVSDFSDDFKILNIPDKRANGQKVSKTFERTIKLMNCSEMVKNYVKNNNLEPDDYFLIKTQAAFNKYLKELAIRLFGDKTTKARGKISQLRLYDIRHLSSIYWLDRYRTHKDLMYRMGWKKEDKVLYYSEFLGRRDKIDDEDMLTKEDKNRLEGEIENQKNEIKFLSSQLKKLQMLLSGQKEYIIQGPEELRMLKNRNPPI